MAEAEITAFLTYLAAKANLAASTQNQALSALLFFYREVLQRKIGWLDHVERARKPARLPVVLTRAEVRGIFLHLHGTMKLMAGLLYGSGLRLMKCVRLRVKDVDLGYLTITVRESKGGKDRVTMLPTNLAQALQRHLLKRRSQHEQDLADGFRWGVFAACACTQVSKCEPTVDVAIRVRFSAAFDRSAFRRQAASSYREKHPSAGGEGSDTPGWDRQAGNVSRFGTRSPLIYSNAATIFGPCKNYSDTAT